MIRRIASYAAVWAIGALVGSLAVPTFAAFKGTTSTSGSRFVAANDWTAPTVSAAVIAKSAGGIAGYIRQGGTYHVYANVADNGNPASGVSTVSADVSSVTSGQTGVALASGAWTIDGVSYNRRSAQLTANAVLAPGSTAFTVSAADAQGNSVTRNALSVTVDNVVPAGSDIQTQNVSGGTLGRAELGDKILYTFTEQIEPISVLSTWDGSATNVVVRINQNANNDLVQIYNSANTSQLSLGQIETNGNYVDSSITYGATGTPSTMVQSGSVITITLGTVSNSAEVNTNGNDTQLWTPSSSATDRAGNACSISVVTELGINDPDF